MQNITMTTKGNKLVIEVDLSKDFGPSKSGKTTVIASTQGNQAVDGHAGVYAGVNIYKK